MILKYGFVPQSSVYSKNCNKIFHLACIWKLSTGMELPLSFSFFYFVPEKCDRIANSDSLFCFPILFKFPLWFFLFSQTRDGLRTSVFPILLQPLKFLNEAIWLYLPVTGGIFYQCKAFLFSQKFELKSVMLNVKLINLCSISDPFVLNWIQHY